MPLRSSMIAIRDVTAAMRRGSLIRMLGWQDVRQRYRRSALGPFWLTISMGVMIGTIGIVFGQIFKTPMHEFLPFLAAGMILWAFFSSVVMEGCTGFISAESIIKQLPIPLFVHILRMIWRNILILLHNIVILPLVFLAVGRGIGWEALLCIPGFVLAAINLTWVALLLAVLCARYRDLPQIVGSALQVVFYLTPIMWMPGHLPQRAGMYLLDLNPVYHVLSVVRSPLLGDMPTALDWYVSGGLAVAGWVFAILLYGRYKRRIAYWL
ncbi:ABC-type polysaccharide/polyol phosphate export permease [Luteibacter sp. HA06]